MSNTFQMCVYLPRSMFPAMICRFYLRNPISSVYFSTKLAPYFYLKFVGEIQTLVEWIQYSIYQPFSIYDIIRVWVDTN